LTVENIQPLCDLCPCFEIKLTFLEAFINLPNDHKGICIFLFLCEFSLLQDTLQLLFQLRDIKFVDLVVHYFTEIHGQHLEGLIPVIVEDLLFFILRHDIAEQKVHQYFSPMVLFIVLFNSFQKLFQSFGAVSEECFQK
jgi:hypothetical protein